MRNLVTLNETLTDFVLFFMQFEYQKFPFNARNALFIGLESIGFMLLVCGSFVLIVMVLIPLVQEKESGVKVGLSLC